MYYDASRTFITLAELKNFTKTSEVLHISQPSVSLHIKNLEKEFQTELFIRSPKYVQITPSGNILYHHAKQILSLYEQVKEDILAHHDSVQGELKIGQVLQSAITYYRLFFLSCKKIFQSSR